MVTTVAEVRKSNREVDDQPQVVDLAKSTSWSGKASIRIAPISSGLRSAISWPCMATSQAHRRPASAGARSAEFQPRRSRTRPGRGSKLQIQVVGLARIADDVSPELARATIESVEVLGAFHASAAVRRALADRIR